MEYPTLITTGADYKPGLFGVRQVELLTLHELAHQWFYGLLASNENAHPFLDEGLATYAETEAAEQWWPGTSLAQLATLRLGMPAVLRKAASQVQHHGPVAIGAGEFASGRDYGRLVYSRTAATLLTIARTWGEQKMRRALSAYAAHARMGHPKPSDLVRHVREQVGKDAAGLLEGVLFRGGFIDMSVESMSSREAARGIFGDPQKPAAAPKDDGGYQIIVVLHRAGTLVAPVDVDLHLANGSSRRMRWDGQKNHGVLRFRSKSELVAVVVDPESRLLLDSNLSNNVKRTTPHRVAPRVLGQVGWLAQLLQAVVAP